MSWFKTKIRPADKEFSIYIRTRDNWECQYHFKCNGNKSFEFEKGGLQCSHFYKRRKETVRFDPDNCDASCIKCHYFVENHKDGQKTLDEWKLKQLGLQKYNALFIRSNQTGRKDDVMSRIQIKYLMKELKNVTTTSHN